MPKIFISQPMSGRADSQIRAERERIAQSVKEMFGEDAEIIGSVPKDGPEGGNVPLKYLAKSLGMLADADYIYIADGWETARGCRIERTCAMEYGIPEIKGCMGGSCPVSPMSGVTVGGG